MQKAGKHTRREASHVWVTLSLVSVGGGACIDNQSGSVTCGGKFIAVQKEAVRMKLPTCLLKRLVI